MPRYVPRLPGTVWSADFLSDTLTCGHCFRIFHVVDDFDREALPIEVDTSITDISADASDFSRGRKH